MAAEDSSASQIDEVLADYFTRRDNGDEPDPGDYLRKYPQLSQELVSFFRKEGVLVNHLDFRAVHAGIARFGDYEILSELGRGGLGIVYHASQVSTGNSVALKVLSTPAASDTKHLIRFQNETISLQQLDHPNIVNVLETGHEAGSPYYAMQLIEGKDLRHWISDCEVDADKGAYSQKVCRMLQPVAEALSHSHELGILHRDIKPSNILIDKTDKAYLVDFGLARVPGAATLTMTGDVVGTLRYASPEQIAGERTAVDERTDIYSFGATLWETLTRRPLMAEEDRRSIIHKVLNAEPVSTRSVDADVPYDMDTIVLRCLAKEPSDRYQSALELSNDLQRFQAGDPIRATRPSMSELALRWTRRNHKAMTASLFGMGLLTVLSLVALGLILRAQSDTSRALDESKQHQRVAQENEEKAMRLLYAADMQKANDAWHAGHWSEMDAKLNAIADYDPERKLRRVAWNLLKEQGSRKAEVLFEADGPVYALAYSPDEKSLISGGGESVIRVHQSGTGELLHLFHANQGDINHVAFSPDGRLFATAGDNGTVKLWDSQSYALIRELSVGEEQVAWTCVFTKDGERLVTTGEQSFLVFRVSDGELLERHRASQNPRGVKLIETSQTGPIYTVQGMGIRKWTSGDAKLRRDLARDVSVEEGGYITDMIVSEEDGFMVTTHRSGGNVVVRDLQTLEPRGTDTYIRHLEQLVYFPKYNMVVACTKEGDIRVLALTKEGGKVCGTKFVTGWVEQREPFAMVSSSDQSSLTYSVGRQVLRVDLAHCIDKKLEATSSGEFNRGYFVSTPYSTKYATVAPNKIQFGPSAGDFIRTKSIDAAVSADGNRVAAITPNGRVCVWDATTKELTHDLELANDRLNMIHFDPTGNYIALRRNEIVEQQSRIAANDAMCVLDLRGSAIRSTGDAKIVSSSVFDYGNRLIYTSRSELICRDATSFDLIWTKRRDLNQAKYSAFTIHPTDNLLAVATLDGQLDIVNTDSGSVVESHRIGLQIVSVAWDVLEERLFVRTSESEIVILDSKTFRPLASVPIYQQAGTGYWLSFIDGGKRLAYCRAEGCQSLTLPRSSVSAW